MDRLARGVAGAGVGAVFIYTHEAHPAENYPHLTSFEQKLTHARALRDVLGIGRRILADSLDGACHRHHGSMPNMTWIYNRAGQPVYKSDWTDVNSVANAVDYYVDVGVRRRNKERLAPFRVERLDYRQQDHDRFYEGLARNGPRAVTEFDAAFD
jgi:hypothetical protein